MSAKTEVYTWRLSPATKSRLEDAARTQRRSVAQLLDELVTGDLDRAGRVAGDEVQRQQRLHLRVRPFLGCLSGRHARRSERVRALVRARLKKRRGHAR